MPRSFAVKQFTKKGGMTMKEEKRFLVEVGMKNLPFPIRVVSKVSPNGQLTVADISIEAHINQ